jgi:addiction module HigA family antidote|nr:MAG TPA: addiction module antidote protein [Caudoviricetes sp.]
MDMFNPSHPGEILKDLYLPDYNLSVTAFALKLGVSRTTASELVNCKNGISAEMALKLAKAFGTSVQYWLNMQQAYDLWLAKQSVNLDNVEIIEM